MMMMMMTMMMMMNLNMVVCTKLLVKIMRALIHSIGDIQTDFLVMCIQDIQFNCLLSAYNICLQIIPFHKQLFFLSYRTGHNLLTISNNKTVMMLKQEIEISQYNPHSTKLCFIPNCTMYEGRSICNENSPVNPKVLYLHTS